MSLHRRGSIFLMLVVTIVLSACRVEDSATILSPTATPAPLLTLDVSGADRTYLLHVPESVASEDAPLVFIVHGLGSNAERVRATSGFDEIADREGFIVAYPNGLSRAWLDAGIGSAFSDSDIASQNIAYLDELIDALQSEYSIDADRIYVAGISNGGMFAFHVACNLSDRVAAVGLVAAASISQSFESCNPAHAVAYLAFHGTSDTVVPYDGGQIVPGFDDLGAFQSAEEAAEFWAAVNGCQAAPTREELPDRVSGDTSIAFLDTWEPCDTGNPVQLVTLDGAGHTWPGHPPPGQRLGGTNLDIDASEMLWEFFSSNPRR